MWKKVAPPAPPKRPNSLSNFRRCILYLEKCSFPPFWNNFSGKTLFHWCTHKTKTFEPFHCGHKGLIFNKAESLLVWVKIRWPWLNVFKKQILWHLNNGLFSRPGRLLLSMPHEINLGIIYLTIRWFEYVLTGSQCH